MKITNKTLLLLFILWIPLNITAQITFEEVGITDENDFIYRPVLFDNENLDLDQDGDFDILVQSNFNIVWYENRDGAGDFSSAKQIYIDESSGIRDMQIGDLDGDGDIDIVCMLSTNTIGWFTNQGNGNFSNFNLIQQYSTNIVNLRVRDIDGDNDQDIIFDIIGQGILWHENIDGLATFNGDAILIPFANSISDFWLGDVNGDDSIDIIFYDFALDQISWYENIGNAVFSSAQAFQINQLSSPSFIKEVDIDGDSNPDFIASATNNLNLVWFEYNGVGQISETIINVENSFVSSLILTDIDADGDNDLLGSRGDNLIWLENVDGMGAFSTPNLIDSQICFGTCGYRDRLATGDFDGNGTIDVISSPASNNSVGFIYKYPNLDGEGTFGNKCLISERLSVSYLEAIDIDNDGDLDVLNGNSGNFSIHRNLDGNANFGRQELISDIDGSNFAISMDVDNDGDFDIVSNRFSPQEDLVWYENNGSGVFSEASVIDSSLSLAYRITKGDIDGDGYQDIALIFSANNSSVYWLKNLNGSGTFSAPMVAAINVNSPGSIALNDLDGDDDLDIVLNEKNTGLIKWYENTDGAGTFASVVELAGGNAYRGVHLADLDQDNDIDIITFGNDIRWFKNTDGQGTFAAAVLIGDPSNIIQFVEVTDLDGDLDLDIVWKSWSSGGVLWYENLTGNEDFSAEIPIFISDNPLVPPVTALGDFNGDSKIDIAHAYGVEISGFLPERLMVLLNEGELGNQIVGGTRINSDFSGCDSNDPVAQNLMITASNGIDSYSTFTLPNGSYSINVGEGMYTTTVSGTLPTYYGANPTQYDFTFNGTGTTELADFCIEPIATVNDLLVSIYPSIDDPRPGFDTTYQIVYRNSGTTQLSGDVTFTFDDAKLQFLNASETVNSQTANTLTFNFADLNPLEIREINLNFNVFPPPTTNIDDVLTTTATINPISGDETPENNTFELEQTVIGSYDPNDIRVLQGDEITIDEIDKNLNYIIRFQNTGTASAINVRVDHLLDSKLDWSTMQLESLSHQGRVEITNDRDVSFIFDNINLPDSTSDEPNSHGYITFKIKPKNTVAVGDIINGVAAIFFDFNPPIITNNASTEIVAPLSVTGFTENGIAIFPNPTKDSITIKANQEIKTVTVYDINGRLLKVSAHTQRQIEMELNLGELSQGIYFLKIQTDFGTQTQKIIKE